MKTIMGLENSSGLFKNPPLHIPDGKGGTYKTELVLFSSRERTEKINWWHSGDPRNTPHNHPWDFTSTILSGGYTEDRWSKSVISGDWIKTTTQYTCGSEGILNAKNTIQANEFHVVYDILPDTVTHMVCGEVAKSSEWGYLNLETYSYIKAEKDPEFFKCLCEQNSFKGKYR